MLAPAYRNSSYFASSQARLPDSSQLRLGSHWYSTSRPLTVPEPALVKSPKNASSVPSPLLSNAVNTDNWMSSYLLWNADRLRNRVWSRKPILLPTSKLSTCSSSNGSAERGTAVACARMLKPPDLKPREAEP